MQPERQEQQERQVREALPMSAKGRLKISNWVIATVPTVQAAEACAQALAAAGVAADDVLVEASATALRQLQAEEEGQRRAGLLLRLISAVEDAATEAPAHQVRDQYVADAQAGRVFVGAHDAQGNQVDFIRNLFLEQGARHLYYFFAPAAIAHLG